MTVSVVPPYSTGPEIATITTKCLDGHYGNNLSDCRTGPFVLAAAQRQFYLCRPRCGPPRGARKLKWPKVKAEGIVNLKSPSLPRRRPPLLRRRPQNLPRENGPDRA